MSKNEVSEHKRTEVYDLRQTLDNFMRDNQHSNDVAVRWFVAYLKPVWEMSLAVHTGKIKDEAMKAAILQFEIDELERAEAKQEVERQRTRETIQLRQRELRTLGKPDKLAKPAGWAVPLVIVATMLLGVYVPDAIAQRVHKYHFECIGAGFSSSQCSFLGDMLRRYGVN